MLHKRVTISTGYTLRQMNGVSKGVQKWAPFVFKEISLLAALEKEIALKVIQLEP